MLSVPKLVSFVISSGLFILLLLLHLLPCVSASQEHGKISNAKISNHHKTSHQLNHQLSFEIIIHGFLLWASMGFLMPVGVLIIRMSNREQGGRRVRIMFYIHASLQTLAVLLATSGAVMSIRNFDNSFNNHHQRIGVALYGLIWLQTLTGIFRSDRGSKGRSVWFLVHWIMGTAVCLLGIINIYTGLSAYHEKTSGRRTSPWTVIFTVQISFMAFVYLFQDKWEYMKKQGGNEPVQPTDQEISPREKNHHNSISLVEGPTK